jgi:predicted transcriptional regulator of viral defense system
MVSKNASIILGPIETAIVSRLTYEKKSIVTANELDLLFNLTANNRKQIVFRLKRKKILSAIKRGLYLFSPLEAGPQGTGIDELLIPPLFFPKKNYYIGYSTMFNYYGFTEQLFQTVYVLNTAIRSERLICGLSYKFIKIGKNRMYGLATLKIKGTDVNISTKERTLVDLLYFNKSVGGTDSAADILREIVKNNKCDTGKLIEYAVRFPNIKTRKLIGLILDDLGISENNLKPLAKSVQKTAISSFSASRKGKLNKKWRIIVNDSRR